MKKINLHIPLIIILVCYLALTQVYRFAHVHAAETIDGYAIELSLHEVHHPHDHDHGHDDHQEEVDHLVGDWNHLHSIMTDLPPFVIDKHTVARLQPNLFNTLFIEPRTGPPPLALHLTSYSLRGPPIA
ncbi:hypothetical protein BH23BAC3_BH23BAC3_26270 [soil metagenome]